MSGEAGTNLVMHDAIKPLEWILGKWKTTQGVGQYPTIKDFQYVEELEFFHVGQPIVQFTFYSFNATTRAPMHREVGFIRIKPGTNEIALISAHNTGLADMEEGKISGEELTLQSTNVGRMSFGTPPGVQKLKRRFRKDGNLLEQVVEMETNNTSLTEHLRAVYERIDTSRCTFGV